MNKTYKLLIVVLALGLGGSYLAAQSTTAPVQAPSTPGSGDQCPHGPGGGPGGPPPTTPAGG